MVLSHVSAVQGCRFAAADAHRAGNSKSGLTKAGNHAGWIRLVTSRPPPFVAHSSRSGSGGKAAPEDAC